MTNLFPDDPLAKKLKEQTLVLSELLEKKAPDFSVPRMAKKALIQGHCHHKSVIRFDDEKKVLGKIGLDYQDLSSGCCGMAGSFGFEADKYDISVKVGEHALLPAVREAADSTLIVADGFSCREQIAQQSDRQGLHLAEVIRMAQRRNGENLAGRLDGARPEAALAAKRKQTRRRARIGALLTLVGVAAAGVAIVRGVKKAA
jgi:Fe-S oxidoreductase